ncbi:MAG: lytic transglycosylase domain-containing protein [Chloracidobacterium sp.]|nr:lytic transglycosylase domain-containing protein [Chloracidobacterium sp.]
MNKYFGLISLILLVLIIIRSTAAQSLGSEGDLTMLTDIASRSKAQFEKGVADINAGRRTDAKIAFDESIEVFLTAKVDIRAVPRLSQCYESLVETIYRIEFPAPGKRVEVSDLEDACGWQSVGSATITDRSEGSISQGFSSQPFEPSPLDELSRLSLTAEETASAFTPEGRVEYVQLERTAATRSLGFTFQMHPMVQQYLNYYQGRGHATMRTGLQRSGMFMLMARKIFREEGIPENVAWLGQVESMWKPTAVSTAAASGLWQFIPSTGERFGLRRTAYVDERNSFERATRASARYLKFLANRYRGNWELALAAYNSGEGNVDRAIRRAGVNSFWAAYPYLPQETRNYVPNILATILIANAPQRYGFGGVLPAPRLEYALMSARPLTNLAFIAKSVGTTVQYLRYLNPELRSNITPPEVYQIRVPIRSSK